MEETLYWFSLKGVKGIGNHLFKRLIQRFKSPRLVFEASHEDLLAVNGMKPGLASAVKQQTTTKHAEKELLLALKKGYRIVTMSDSDYPRLLLEIPDPPPFLYVYGNLDRSINNIAVVGSRNATSYGISATERLCSALASLDIITVSGMARGIDTAAHKGALMGKGKTVAVLGSGLEKVYPAENRNLFHQIAESGAVISEFSLMTEPEAHNFPIRNRVISGISLGTVVVEATRNSGSLITARLAAEQNREVFAVPGNIHSFKSAGTHTLIKQGAKLVEHAQDIVAELSPVIQAHINTAGKNNHEKKDVPILSSEESFVFESLSPYPVHIDDLVRKLSIEPGRLASVLMQLEIKGVVQQSPGKLFSIIN